MTVDIRGTGGVTIGDVIVGGTNYANLYVDGSGNLANGFTQFDGSGVSSVDYSNRRLNSAFGGFAVLDWSLQQLIIAGNSSLDWAQRYLYDGDGTSVVLDWDSQTLSDLSGVASMEWNSRKLRRSNGDEVFNYNTGVFTDPNGPSTAMNVLNRILVNPSETTVMTWSGTVPDFNQGVEVSDLTSGRVTYATTNGRLTDSAAMTFDGTNLELANGLELVDTTTSTTGIIFKGVNRFLHNYKPASSSGNNLFLGVGAGNFTMAYSTADFSADYNISVGNSSLVDLTTGARNIVMGSSAGNKMTTGTDNVGMGHLAMFAATTARYNFGLGSYALDALTEGLSNVAIGVNAGGVITSGSYNMCIGAGALAGALTTGAANVGVGTNAGYYTSGQYNTFIGYGSAQNNSTGGNNVAIGYEAGLNSQTGARNCFIGMRCGRAAGNYTGANDNTFVGYEAGYTMANSSSTNVYIGRQSGYYETGSQKLFIDNQSRTDEATSRISSLIYGVFNATVASQTLAVNAGTFTLNGGTNSDITFNFTGTTNSGVLKWMEDEDYFEFVDDIKMTNNETILLGGSGFVDSPKYKAGGTEPVADGTYTMGLGSTNGTITIKGGIITAVQQVVA